MTCGLESGSHVKDFIGMMRVERGAAVNTLDSYGRDLERFFNFFKGKKLVQMTEHDIAKYCRAMHSLSRATRQRHMSCLRQFFGFLMQEGVLDSDPTANISLPSGSHIPKAIEETMANKLFEVAFQKKDENGIRLLCILELLYSTGVRVSELVSLPYPLHFTEGNMLKVEGKGGRERLVCVNRNAIAALESYINVRSFFDATGTNEWLFPSSKCRAAQSHITRQRVFQLIRALAKEAGIGEISPHVLRHTMATHLLEGGADLISIRNMLGHASVNTTQIYTCVSARRKLETVGKYHPLSETCDD